MWEIMAPWPVLPTDKKHSDVFLLCTDKKNWVPLFLCSHLLWFIYSSLSLRCYSDFHCCNKTPRTISWYRGATNFISRFQTFLTLVGWLCSCLCGWAEHKKLCVEKLVTFWWPQREGKKRTCIAEFSLPNFLSLDSYLQDSTIFLKHHRLVNKHLINCL